MDAAATLLVILLSLTYLRAEWVVEECPTSCVCHQVWSDRIRSKLNAVECQDRDMDTLDPIPTGSEALFLSGNGLKIDTVRGNLTAVRYLDLSNNKLKIHQQDLLCVVFARLPSLQVLDLSNNKLESLLSTLFANLTRLEYLSLSANAIVFVERDAFRPLINLRMLKLDTNHLPGIDKSWAGASQLSRLRELDLSNNRLQSVDAMDFGGMTNLERLDLSGNVIADVDPLAFGDCPIQELYLNGNRLSKVPMAALQALSNLTILRLDANPITRVGAGDLSNLPRLLQVSLSDMPRLRAVEKSAFRNLPQLQRVDLQQNGELAYIDGAAFINCTNVKFLHVHTCALRGLDQALYEHLPALVELSFYDNPVHCSCLARWIVESNLTLVDGSRIACASPHGLHNQALQSIVGALPAGDCAPIVIPMAVERVVDFGTDVKLECLAIGQKSVKWLGPHRREMANGSTLLLESVEHEQEGVYTCVATSERNTSDSESTYVRVVHTLIQLRVEAVSKTFVDLSWNETSGAKRVSYITPNGESVRVDVPEGATEVTIDDLRSDTTYAFCLYYHHEKEHHCVTARTLARQRDDLPTTPRQVTAGSRATTKIIIATLIVVSVVLVAVGPALLVYKKCRRYTKAKAMYKRYKSENSLLDSASHIKLDQCYNPTTEPLYSAEPT